MSDIEEYDIGEWVREASGKANIEFRQAVHTILSAIAFDKNLKASMILKGGILLAIRYKSHRYTRDIDFSTEMGFREGITPESIGDLLNKSLVQMVECLDYGLDCRVQSSKQQPKGTNAKYPSINISVGYAYKGTAKYRRLELLQSPDTISIDYSLNEVTPNIEGLTLTVDEELLAYSLTDLIAEKYRSLLQQVVRNRARRQDVYDLNLLIGRLEEVDGFEKNKILNSLISKSNAREIKPNINSFDDPELKHRAKIEYSTLEDEIIGELPDFENLFEIVHGFYKSLPWE